jgi:competence protein ComEC
MRGRVLYGMPFTREMIERGDTIETDGLFFPLPFERSEGYARYLQSTGIEAIFEGYRGKVAVLQKAGPIHLANRMKRYVEQVHKGLLPPPQDSFATALLTGNRDFIPRELMDLFRRSGTMHILAVSGLHVGFLSLFVLFFLRLIRVPKIYAYVLVSLFIVFFMIFIGERPSVHRASFMALCGIACFLFDRDRNYLNVLALSFIVLWLINPLSLINPGFLLSFCATFGILFITPSVFRWLKGFMPRFLAGSIAVTLSVQLFIFPVMASYFGTFSYINVIANLPIVPLTGVSLALGVLTLVFYPLFLPLAVLTAEVNTAVIATITRLAVLFSYAPPLQIQGFPLQLVPVYLVPVTLGLWFLLRYKKSPSIHVGGLQERSALGDNSH